MKTIKIKNYSERPEYYTGKVEYENGTIEYFLNGKYHCLEGPAIIWFNSYKSYYINNKFICSSDDKNHKQKFYNSKEYKQAKQQEDLLNNMKLIKNIT